MAYQFDWSVGKGLYFEDIVLSNRTGGSSRHIYFYYGIIDEIKDGIFGGTRPLKYVDLDGKAPNEQGYVDTNGGRIIQGIGITEWNDGECLFGPPNPYRALSMFDNNQRQEDKYSHRYYRSMLVHFERDGEILYNVWPKKETTNVKTVSKESAPTTSTLYDLQGRRLTAKPAKGLYIQNGQKIISK